MSPRHDRQLDAVAADRRAVDPGDFAIDGGVVDQKAGLEIVGAVEDQVDVLEQILDIGGRQIGDHRFDGHFGIHTRQPPRCRYGFGQRFGRIGFFKQELALQVGPFDEIAVDDAQPAHSGARHGFGLHGSQRPAADDGDCSPRGSWLGLLHPAARSGFGGSNGIRRGASNSGKALVGLIQMVAAGPQRPPCSRSAILELFEAYVIIEKRASAGIDVSAAAARRRSGVGSEIQRQSQVLEGRTIGGSISIPATQPLPRNELDRLLPLHVGSPLHQADVRQSLQKLFDTGRFADVAIDAELAGDGVALRISTQLNYFVGGVSFEGVADPPNRNQLLTATKLELGRRSIESQLKQSIDNLQERLRANGLHRATIRYDLDRDPSTEEVGVRFQLNAGPRARFDGVQLTGKFERPADKIIRATRYRRGFSSSNFRVGVTPRRTGSQTGIERVRKRFPGAEPPAGESYAGQPGLSR